MLAEIEVVYELKRIFEEEKDVKMVVCILIGRRGR
jgi:hypothetical protein